jgi:SNF2 family DNA or RNA helicase
MMMDDEAEQEEAARAEGLVSSSGKLKLLDRMLIQLKKEGHRVLLFSQMTSMLDILEEYLNMRRWRYQRLDGSTRASERQSRIDSFNRSVGAGSEVCHIP